MQQQPDARPNLLALCECSITAAASLSLLSAPCTLFWSCFAVPCCYAPSPLTLLPQSWTLNCFCCCHCCCPGRRPLGFPSIASCIPARWTPYSPADAHSAIYTSSSHAVIISSSTSGEVVLLWRSGSALIVRQRASGMWRMCNTHCCDAHGLRSCALSTPCFSLLHILRLCAFFTLPDAIQLSSFCRALYRLHRY